MISTGFGKSKVLMDIEAYERDEAAQQVTSTTPTTITQSESPSTETSTTSPSQKSASREITALDRESTVQQQPQLQDPVKVSETATSKEERQEKMAEKCLQLKAKAASINSLLNDTLDNMEAIKKVLSDPELKKKYQDLSDISNRITQDRVDNCGYVPK
jgi:hypothetical protein